MRVAILQSNYLPWKGYFDIVRKADLFIFYDDVQFTKNDWRNRNRIKTANGLQWLTVPVGQDINRRVDEVTISQSQWQSKHFQSICQSYNKAPCFSYVKPLLEDMLLYRTWGSLSELNQSFITRVSKDMLELPTVFARSGDFQVGGARVERLVNLLQTVGATSYLSGPAAKAYLTGDPFREAGITLEFMDYSRYPVYDQLHGTFEHHVSVIDLLSMIGSESVQWLAPQTPAR